MLITNQTANLKDYNKTCKFRMCRYNYGTHHVFFSLHSFIGIWAERVHHKFSYQENVGRYNIFLQDDLNE